MAAVRNGIFTQIRVSGNKRLKQCYTNLFSMNQDDKLNEIAANLEGLKTDMSWLREAWSHQQKAAHHNEKRLSALEADVAMQKGKPGILMMIITALTAVLAAVLGWVSTK